MINSGLWLLLIALALLLGWYLGFQVRIKQKSKRFRFHRDYIIGLNYLLNEEPDKAVDVFIKMLQVDAQTVETHLALGSLFRRRGELDRAIKIHQNLVTKDELDKVQRVQALNELGKDYLSAGVLDRAEDVFKEVVNVDDHPLKSLYALLDIYEQEKDWVNAIEVAKQVELVSGKRMLTVIAQYYCEIADTCVSQNRYDFALSEVKKALSIDSNCVRASLIKAGIECRNHHYKAALKTCKKIESQDAQLLFEGMDIIIQSYVALDQSDALVSYLKQLVERYPKGPMLIALVTYLREQESDEHALSYLTQYVHDHPSFAALSLLLELRLNVENDEKGRSDLQLLHKLIVSLMSHKAPYRCGSCGFSSRAMHWQCPSCKTWKSVRRHELTVA